MVPSFFSSHLTELYDSKAFIAHAALLRQGFPHCAKFLTAASRRSLDRVSVPVWPFTLSGRLTIIALVGLYPTNKLMVRELTFKRKLAHSFTPSGNRTWSYPVLAPLSRSYSSFKDRLFTRYSPLRHCTRPRRDFLVRLACVRHAASVCSEPGSNSPNKFI